MDFKHISVAEVLSIDNVELYQTSGHSGSLITKGTLYLLYSQEYDWYILKVNDFNYGISKKVPVLASSHERGAVRAYVVPNPQGYFVIKVTAAVTQENLNNFENILKNVTEFGYKEGQGSEGLPVKLGNQTVTVKEEAMNEVQTGERPQTNAAHIIYNGGKSTKKLIVSTAQGISNGITRLGGHFQNNIAEKPEEAQIKPKTANRLALLTSATGMVSSTSTIYMKGLTSLGNWIGQKIETKFEKKTAEKEAAKMHSNNANRPTQTQQTQPEGVMGVGYATIYSAISIWQGMVEALDIIRGGITETASGLVASKYGPVAGEVLRAGLSVAGNAAIPGSRFLKMR